MQYVPLFAARRSSLRGRAVRGRAVVLSHVLHPWGRPVAPSLARRDSLATHASRRRFATTVNHPGTAAGTRYVPLFAARTPTAVIEACGSALQSAMVLHTAV